MNLKETARLWVLNYLPYDRSDADLVAHLTGLDATGLLIVYQNWMSRLVQRRPRQIHTSATLTAKLPASVHRGAVDKIVRDLRDGADVTPYLSRGVRIAAQVPGDSSRLGRRRDLDLMLTSWHMHHFHLGSKVDADGFVERTDDLLFAIIRNDDAYLVDIMPHGSWSSDHLLKIALDELPGSQAVHVLEGVIDLAHHPTEAEHQTLRNAGVNSIRMIGGRAVLPAGSISTAGTSFRATREAQRAVELLEAFEANWADHPDEIREACREGGQELPDEPDFHFIVTTDQGAGILEKQSRAFLPFPE